MTHTSNSIRAERERAKRIIAEGRRLRLPAEVVDAGIKKGTSVAEFIAEHDAAAALADQIVASAKAARGWCQFPASGWSPTVSTSQRS
jgi:hypothetical protein